MLVINNRAIFLSLVLATFALFVSAECPNACSSHGKCGAFDSCQCYRNWMSNDCSERICQFGLAHVDTPKGDLDSSGGVLYPPGSSHSSTNPPLITNTVYPNSVYPQGTFELFPSVVDTFNSVIDDSAHEYRECSNKGICDRAAGSCTCFEGYDGSACQRASCPTSGNGVCSGHGLCSTIKEIARFDYNNTYDLWDEFSSMGCICDAGFSGPDCSEKVCKVGTDPLYADEINTRFSNYTFAIYNIDAYDAAKDTIMANTSLTIRRNAWSGNYSIVFYDSNGQDWHTTAIDINAGCDEIRHALESLPNNVIEANTVRCSLDWSTWGSYANENQASGMFGVQGPPTLPATGWTKAAAAPDGFPIALPNGGEYIYGAGYYVPYVATKFTLAFPSNPGNLKQPSIDMYLDGSRPTVTAGPTTTSISSVVRSWVFANGFTGETFDFVPDLCLGVTVSLKGNTLPTNNWGTLTGLTPEQVILLKKCLGDADGDSTNNNINKDPATQDALYNWDYGYVYGESPTPTQNTLINPHLVKLVDTLLAPQTRLCDNIGHFFTGVDNILGYGYCANPKPPGFYLVLYYDASTKTFKYLSKPHQDYSVANIFNVYTTTGTLQLASKYTDVFTSYNPASTYHFDTTHAVNAIADLTTYYSNVVYTAAKDALFTGITAGTNGVTSAGSYSHNVDCETGVKTNILQCIQKGDYVMILDSLVELGSFVSNNPKYLNIYQVMKISRENRETTPEMTRYQIVLDNGVNARYLKANGVGLTSNARIFKFTPPANAYSWAEQCSNRGICDTTTGVCGCFSGYTGDDCSVLNALAQ